MVIIQKQVVLANLLSLAFLLKTAKWICMFLLTVLIIKLKEWKLIDINVYFFYTCKLPLRIINRSDNWLWYKEKNSWYKSVFDQWNSKSMQPKVKCLISSTDQSFTQGQTKNYIKCHELWLRPNRVQQSKFKMKTVYQ